MTIRRTIPICFFCKHFDHEHWYAHVHLNDRRCAAFPAGIPDLITGELWDHREHLALDNDIQFELEEDLNELKQRGRFLPDFKTIAQVKRILSQTFDELNTMRVMGFTKPPLRKYPR